MGGNWGGLGVMGRGEGGGGGAGKQGGGNGRGAPLTSPPSTPDAPTARIHPSQSVLREGDTLVLTCAVTGNPL